jgi:hypothetical protein
MILLCIFVSFAGYLYFRPKPRSLLIIGCARSGTTYIARALKQRGLRIGHERVQSDGSSSWPLAVLPVKDRFGVRPGKYRFAHIFHQVRDPLKVISSVYVTEGRQSWNYIMKHLPEIDISDSHLVKCAKYWYYWNVRAEKNAEWTYAIEELDDKWDEFDARLGKKLLPKTCLDVPKDKNTRLTENRKLFTWKDLKRELSPELYLNIKRLAQKYGYPTEQD